MKSRSTRTSWAIAALLSVFLLGHAAHAAVFTVNSIGDQSDVFPGDGVAEVMPGTGITTLRAAIEEANVFPGPDTIILGGNPVILSALPPLNDPTGGTTIRGAARTNTIIRRDPWEIRQVYYGPQLNGKWLDKSLPGYATTSGFRIHSANNVIEGVTVVNFPQDGVAISGSSATGNLVRRMHIGIHKEIDVDYSGDPNPPQGPAGGVPAGNGRHGISIAGGASGNLIGGMSEDDRVIITDNDGDGIHISDEGTAENIVANCFIGLSVTSVPICVERVLNGLEQMTDTCRDQLKAYNCHETEYTNHGNNVTIRGGATDNIVGVPGTLTILCGGLPECRTSEYPDLGCGLTGLFIPSTGPGKSGIVIEGTGTEHNRVENSWIGFRHQWALATLSGAGGRTLAHLRTRSAHMLQSVEIRGGAANNIIGGDGDEVGNEIAYSMGEGILIAGGSTTGNRVSGNNIFAEKNAVAIRDGAHGNIIGSSSGWGNVIASRHHGLALSGMGTRQNRVIGNTFAGNFFSGVAIFGGATENFIGGPNSGDGNRIAGACSDGVILYDPGTEGNQILGNEIHGNGEIGVFMVNGASNNIIGGTTPGSGNKIHGNAVTGVEIHDVPSTGNKILGNEIYNNGTRGVFMVDGTSGNIVGGELPAERNKIYENKLSGIEINGPLTFENQIRLNSIYDNEGKGILLTFGANKGILPPVIESFVPFAGTAAPNSTIDVFSDAAEEGKFYIGTLHANEEGRFSGTLNLGAFGNTFLTATATDDVGDTSEFSAPVFITPPSFTVIPNDRVVVAGDTLTLAVTTAGSPLIAHHWRFRTQTGEFINLVNGETIQGADTTTLTVTNITEAGEGYYQCIADNGLSPAVTPEIYIRVVSADLAELEVNAQTDVNDGNTSSFARLLASPGEDGKVSLREALIAANSMTGPNTIRFAAEGTLQIEAPLPAIADPTGGLTLDGAGRITLDGALSEPGTSGLTVVSAENVLRGFTIQNFPDSGILLTDSSATDNTITRCVLGGNLNGVTLSNGARDNVIGGTEPGDANRLGANLNAGVVLSGHGTSQNRLIGNRIGSDPEAGLAEGNTIAAVLITEGASDNEVGGTESGSENQIVDNPGIGVWVVGVNTARNTIQGNTIYGNGDLGIRLFEGGNQNVARPEITSVSPLAGFAPPLSRIDCYIDAADEGEEFLITLIANAQGAFGADLDLQDFDGRYLNAIATDVDGNTSAFSRPAGIDFTPPVLTLLGSSPISLECGGVFNDPGASAQDNIDGNISHAIEVQYKDGEGNDLADLTAVAPGTYTVIYQVSDEAGLAATPVVRSVVVADTTAPVITLTGDSTVTTACGVPFDDPGASTVDGCDATPEIQITGAVDTASPGQYQLTYRATDSAGNTSAPVVRTVTVEDQVPPVLTLLGATELALNCGTPFEDPGAEAVDACGGSSTITVEGTVIPTEPGVYLLTYRAEDAFGNRSAPQTRSVVVSDGEPPAIVLNGRSELILACGAAYVELGAEVRDICDNVAEVSITGELDTSRYGVYTLFYDVADAAGNAAATVTRTITVSGETPPVITLTGSASVTVACNGNYVDAGARAADGCLTDISGDIVTDNPVNTGVPGTYSVTYNVTDGVGVAAETRVRTVTVLPCNSPCEQNCAGRPGNDVDADGDGLSACVESCLGTSDQDLDSDNDGMDDGFEYRNQLDPKLDDADLDPDLDGFTNLEEFLEGSGPRDPASPARTFYVSPDGTDTTVAGTRTNPWQSLAYALDRLRSAPSGRNQLFLNDGVYLAGVTVPQGIQVHAAPGAAVELVGSVVLQSGAGLHELTVLSDTPGDVLLYVAGNGVQVIGCVLEGGEVSDLTGLLVETTVTTPAIVEGCVFQNLAVGIIVEGALPHVRHCQFINIGEAGIRLEATASGLNPDNPGTGLSGWNDFSQIGAALAIANLSGGGVAARWNEWGTEVPAELADLVSGDVDQTGALPDGGAGSASALHVVVLNGKTQARVRNAQVTLAGAGLSLRLSTGADGRAIYPALAPGNWQYTITASGLESATASLTLAPGVLRVAPVALMVPDTTEPPITGCSAPGKHTGQGDLVLLSLILGALVLASGMVRLKSRL